MKNKICKLCEKKIKNENDLIKPSLGYVHIVCYRDKLSEKYSDIVVEEKIKHFIDKRNIEISEQLKKIKTKHDIKLKNIKNKAINTEFKVQFFDYIILNYGCTLNTRVFSKVSNIVNGTFKGLQEGITYEDLLYMFKTKQNELNRIAEDKKRKGNIFKSDLDRLNFDIAVIVNKYDSYKKWKQKQNLLKLENDKINITEEEKDILGNMNKIIKQNENTSDDNNFNNIVDDIY